jgi:hypothetical protein
MSRRSMSPLEDQDSGGEGCLRLELRHRASEYSHSIDDEIESSATMVSPAFLCRIPVGLARATENQRDSQELVIYH